LFAETKRALSTQLKEVRIHSRAATTAAFYFASGPSFSAQTFINPVAVAAAPSPRLLLDVVIQFIESMRDLGQMISMPREKRWEKLRGI
jgi:hypothetical protein